VWWISSIIGLQAELVTYIDKLRIDLPAPEARNETLTGRTTASINPCNELQDISKKESNPEDNYPTGKDSILYARDIQEDPRPYDRIDKIHPDMIHQIGKKTLILNSEEECDSEPNQQSFVLKKAEQFLQKSRKDRKAFKKQKAKDQLSRTRSGKIIAKPLSNKQRQYLQSIPKDTIVEYIADRIQDLRPCT